MKQELGLKLDFTQALRTLSKKTAKVLRHPLTEFDRMLAEHGGVETCRRLIHDNKMQDGYQELWEKKRLDLTIEAFIFDNPKWHSLFSDQDHGKIFKRLKDTGYLPAPISQQSE